MSKRNSRTRQLSKARKIQAEKRKNAPRLQLLTTITTCLESMSFENLQELQNNLDKPENKSSVEKIREKLIENIISPISKYKGRNQGDKTKQ